MDKKLERFRHDEFLLARKLPIDDKLPSRMPIGSPPRVQTKKINNEVVHPVVTTVVPVDKIKGGKLFSEVYANIFLCAKKKSGKTSVIYKIMRKSLNKDTKVYIFCPTVEKDGVYQELCKWLDKKGIYYEKHLTLGTKKDNKLSAIVNSLLPAPVEEKEEKSGYKGLFSQRVEEKVKEYVYKPKKIAPENVFIFDDISGEIKHSKALESLVKMNRHIRSKVLISSQSYNDLPPPARKMMDYILLFGGLNSNKVEQAYKDGNVSGFESVDDFIDLYREVTAKKYDFMYIDVNDEKFRKNFNEEIEL